MAFVDCLLRVLGARGGGPPVTVAPGGWFVDSLGAEDTVLLQRGADVRSGEMVVVEDVDGLKLRRLYFCDCGARLEGGEGPEHATTARHSALRVHGRVVAIARRRAIRPQAAGV
jgi:hypothetical protein